MVKTGIEIGAEHVANEVPFGLFGEWFAAAEAAEPDNPNAMTLATATTDGAPSARIVLLKGWDEHGFVFYTNFESRKGMELAANPGAALLFYWKSLSRQIRIEGSTAAVTEAEADEYYGSRPRLSRIGAWASDQSRPLASRAALEARVASFEARYPGEVVPRPPFWSGFRLMPARFEFWQERPFRLHERRIFVRAGTGWQTGMLYP
ncbi:MAG TPA: pyridoxamine 5'-phosphate oxidase [Acetobacteraceae bacterium]|nr:pyridoxamine 5'-phosphate oxidase [Acetobacteraceae bacterium]